MYCTRCGTQNDNDSRFCIKCGTDLQSDIDTVKIKNTDIKKSRTGKFNIKSRKIIIAIICAIIIVLAALIFIFNNYKDISQTTQNQTTEVLISSAPPGANIYINDISRGNAPIKINLPEGNYSLKINLTGYNGTISDFKITSDMAKLEINATLESIGNKSINEYIK